MVGVHARVLNLFADAQQPGEVQDAEGRATQNPGPQADHDDQDPDVGMGMKLGVWSIFWGHCRIMLIIEDLI